MPDRISQGGEERGVWHRESAGNGGMGWGGCGGWTAEIMGLGRCRGGFCGRRGTAACVVVAIDEQRVGIRLRSLGYGRHVSRGMENVWEGTRVNIGGWRMGSRGGTGRGHGQRACYTGQSGDDRLCVVRIA
jgi:hypothetical protein